jgi:hypothetical protein
LKKLDWDVLGKCRWTKKYHGDLQFDNILFDGRNFTLIDWRHSFGDQSEWGDVYYDLAKLYGGTLINYRLMKDPKNISVIFTDESVDFFCKHTEPLTRFLPVLEKWIIDRGFDLNHVRLLTGLIWLNMAPLHEQPFSDMLFYKSKEMLASCLCTGQDCSDIVQETSPPDAEQIQTDHPVVADADQKSSSSPRSSGWSNPLSLFETVWPKLGFRKRGGKTCQSTPHKKSDEH